MIPFDADIALEVLANANREPHQSYIENINPAHFEHAKVLEALGIVYCLASTAGVSGGRVLTPTKLLGSGDGLLRWLQVGRETIP